MSAYHCLKNHLLAQPRVWLVTGAAGFIGSNLVEQLLLLNQTVVGLDNYSTGSHNNLDEVCDAVGPQRWKQFQIIEGDIQDLDTCRRACSGVHYVLHQAALGSVPRSISNPVDTHASNVSGFLNMLVAARDASVKRFVYASSSSVYGDHPDLPKSEAKIGSCISPYAATKRMNELYALVFGRCYQLESIGLRYFNVFGPRQDPNGPYAAVIPCWIAALVRNEPVYINGDGETTRDFCYVLNAVQANLLAATVEDGRAVGEVFNVAVQARTSLNALFEVLHESLLPWHPELKHHRPTYRNFRAGDVRHSEADISKARRLLGYEPAYTLDQGLAEALDWYRRHLGMPAQEKSWQAVARK